MTKLGKYLGIGLVVLLSHVALWAQPYEVLPPDQSYEVYPAYMQALGDNMSAALIMQKNALLYAVNANMPGYVRSDMAMIKKNNQIVPIRFYVWDKGTPIASHRSLDVYINHEKSFFTVLMPDKTKAYTRDGRFYREWDGKLVTMVDQRPVLGENDAPMYIPESDVHISDSGEIFQGDERLNRLLITTFESLDGLWGYNGLLFYIKDPKKSQINKQAHVVLIPKHYESSNVDALRIPPMRLGIYMETSAKTVKKITDSYEDLLKTASP